MNDKTSGTGRPRPVPEATAAGHRARFAKEMARSVFGRSYWTEEMEREKRAASVRKGKQEK